MPFTQTHANMYSNTSKVDLHDDEIVVGYSLCSSTCTLSVVHVSLRLVSNICSRRDVFKIETSAPFSKESVQTCLPFFHIDMTKSTATDK